MASDNKGKDLAKHGSLLTAKFLGLTTSIIVILVIIIIVFLVAIMSSHHEEEEKKKEESTSGEYTVNGGTVQNPKSDYAQNEVPKEFEKLYKEIAKKYNIDWQLLAGIHRVETAFSSNVQSSSAGAIGHTQFMKCTWAGWGSSAGCSGGLGNADIPKETYTDPKKIKKGGGEGVDGNGNGKADPMEISDALSATAKKLEKDGANDSPEKAVHSYNHSGEYVSKVMGHYNAYKDNVKFVKAGIKDPEKLGKTDNTGGSSGGKSIKGVDGKLPKPDKDKFNLQPTYPYGQCTWYVHQRRHQIGKDVPTTLGNGGDWGDNAKSEGFKVNGEAKVGAAASIKPGNFGAPAPYGHVAFVEKVKDDGGIVVSESNVKGEGVISYREFSKADTKKMQFIHDK
ncbi:CHAP domain-containing protein [Staphylococcus saprophyticus]|uniref:lytic transglycosylase domain-containing protein n=1 Tax=Staphylococcus saprophyticus TaxID=29385 RepID=UPI002DB85398|nr:CHAP domain-containing protein [Staphylococcus saprophyticus]MEB7678019.1 CHAP domain-containing protein [Staphylococcus saprophyticus]